MMRPKRFRAGAVLPVLLFILLIWPAYQLYGLLQPHSSTENPMIMLYEVAHFQMNLLNGSMQEAKRYDTATPLNKVKLVAYSTVYTHERLVKAVGAKKLTSLAGLSRFVEFVTVLQMSGERQLTDTEKEILGNAADHIATMYESYAHLFNASGQIISSKNDELQSAEQQLISALDRYLKP
ncbi:S-adenosylmethionine decarboxylase [Paenibacillus sp. OSY-SE]|uniref:S-adenosylmethionine decarboxylase n=1 Tax=Paenibacillus sp. OSY-SE TaxID=1196323 RepID=UPI001ED961B4|nr:S-adenosylmethionine decarboxylase [Paenibacillus sp. OSY-SE]